MARAPARPARTRVHRASVRLACLVGACTTLACGAPSRADESEPPPETARETTPPPSPAPAAPSERAPNEPTAFERELDRWLARAAEITVHVGEQGSGTIVSRDGLVLTAMHVVDELDHITVRWPDGTESAARLGVRDEAHDLALLATDRASDVCAPIAREPIGVGAWVLDAGFAGPVSGAVPPQRSLGLVLGASTLPPIEGHPDRAALLTSAHVAPGMSGGPAIDAEGQLVGLVAALGGRLAPIAGSPTIEGVSCDVPFARVALGEVVRDPQHDEPDRDASLRAHLAPRAARASIGPRRGDEGAMPHPSLVQLHVGLGLFLEGVVVADGVVLTLADPGLGTIEAPRAIAVTSHPDARVLGPIAFDAELALVRVENLHATPLDRASVSRAPRGRLLEGAVSERVGVVTDVGVVPGHLVPYVPAPTGRHCGTLANMRYLASPPVDLDRPLLVHDVIASRGELLRDARGAPVAMHVADHTDGVGYAVPLADALARFAATLR